MQKICFLFCSHVNDLMSVSHDSDEMKLLQMTLLNIKERHKLMTNTLLKMLRIVFFIISSYEFWEKEWFKTSIFTFVNVCKIIYVLLFTAYAPNMGSK